MKPARPLTKEMRDALRAAALGSLGRGGEGWLGPGGVFIAHTTVKGLERRRLVRAKWTGDVKRMEISDSGRAALEFA